MKFFGLRQRDIVAFAFFGEDVKDDGLIAAFGELERVDQHRQIVAVDGAEVAKAHFLENETAAITAAAV